MTKFYLLTALFVAVAFECYNAQTYSPWSKIVCEHNGTASCTCPPGWTGKNCSIPLECCTIKVLSDGHVDEVDYCVHGTCTQNDDGCTCNCTEGWVGKRCQDPKGLISPRCIAYNNTDYTGDVTYHCNPASERCIPDDIDCMFNTAPATDADGNKYCPEKKRSECDGLCKCKNPEGWCIHLGPYQQTYRFLALARSGLNM